MKTLCACLVFLSVLGVTASNALFKDGVPAKLPQTKQYDFKSKINDVSYRVWITAPATIDPGAAYPAMYILGGNELAGTAAYVSTKLAFDKEIRPAVVVVIGYPYHGLDKWLIERARDLTPFRCRPNPNDPGSLETNPTGGGNTFLRVIDEEIKPFVAGRFRIDKARQSIWGQSYGGLLVLHAMFRNPTAFSTYCISSPAIWYNDREGLAEEAAFSRRGRSGELNLRILVNSAGDEQYKGSDPKLLDLPDNKYGRMIDNASELADRLAALNPRIHVARTIFPGESHSSATSSSLVRSLRFALGVN
jgi:predicted alpha/beta superfamily hydrolase